MRMESRAPRYWWDFRGDDVIVVESDMDKYPLVGWFKYHGLNASFAINRASMLIDDLNAGRKSPKDAAREAKQENSQ